MAPTIITKGIKAGEAIQEYIQERMDTMLSHTQNSIDYIMIRLSDTNRIKSGFKKRCLIQLSLTEFAADMKSAFDSATRRASRLLNKTLSKAKEISHTTMPLYINRPILDLN